jgi:hypothetical protein
MLKNCSQSETNLLFSLPKTHASSWCCLTKHHSVTSRQTPVYSTAISLQWDLYCRPLLCLLCRPAFLLLIRMLLLANVTFWSAYLFVRFGYCNHFITSCCFWYNNFLSCPSLFRFNSQHHRHSVSAVLGFFLQILLIYKLFPSFFYFLPCPSCLKVFRLNCFMSYIYTIATY